MKEKFITIIKDVFDRLKSPVVWAGIISIVGLIFTTAGFGFEDVPTWEALFDVIMSILTSPAKLGLIIVALYGLLNNPTNKEKF